MTHKKLLIIIFIFILLFLPVLTLITLPREEKPFSENENRYLAEFPSFSFEKVFDRRFMKGFEAWASDMFYGRTNWIKIKNSTELLLGKTELNDVFVTPKMQIQKWESYDKIATDKILAAVNDFAARTEEIPVFFMLVPTAQEIYPENVPANADTAHQRSFIKYCYDSLENVDCIDITPILSEYSDRYIYYRTDHHWTSLGAYLGYSRSSEKMNFTPIDISNFNIEHASNSFLGTLFSKTLYTKTSADTVDFYHLAEGDPAVTVEVSDGNTVTAYDSLYFREYLNQKDKYASFLGNNTPLMNIKTELGSGKKLLIFKDSFANCLIPFYSKNYSEITVVDMRFINADYRTFVDIKEFDQILFVYNVITFSEDTNLIKLNLGKN